MLLFFLGKMGRYAGGNPVCERPTPEWQKGISAFMKKLPDKEPDEDEVENQPEKVEEEVENQPAVEVTDEEPASENVAR